MPWLVGQSLTWSLAWLLASMAVARESVPDRLVVLTFDDSVKSHFTVVRPILKKYGFGATFFITEGFDFRDNKTDYMTWEEIATLHRDGFEIGNHTRDHLAITDEQVAKLPEQLAAINARCKEYNLPPTTSFAWPGNTLSKEALAVLAEHGIRFARRGGSPEFAYDQGRGFAYEPHLDHPLLIPSAGDARPDWELDDFIQAVGQARFGRIAVLQFHGVPDRAHAWVNTPEAIFEQYMHYLAEHDFKVIALRDVGTYVDPSVAPQNAWGVIEDRQAVVAAQVPYDQFRAPANDDDLRFWLTNMLVDHRYSVAEASTATGLDGDQVADAVKKLDIHKPIDLPSGVIRVLPYPGGRHPRTGFRDGAIRPQRETKISAFLPWDSTGYVVIDLPEAIWWTRPSGRELLYLAHTHVKTTWDRQDVRLEPLEWMRSASGWRTERVLPNGVRFGATAEPREREVQLTLTLHNGSTERLEGLVVQNCVMLAAAPGFEQLTKENKLIEGPFVACHDGTKSRWIVTAWQSCVRPWANAPCPCMHSDPQFPDCPPGESRVLRGVVSFHEGPDVTREFARLRALGYANTAP